MVFMRVPMGKRKVIFELPCGHVLCMFTLFCMMQGRDMHATRRFFTAYLCDGKHSYVGILCIHMCILNNQTGMQTLSGPGVEDETSHMKKVVNQRRAGELFARASKLCPSNANMHFHQGLFLEKVSGFQLSRVHSGLLKPGYESSQTIKHVNKVGARGPAVKRRSAHSRVSVRGLRKSSQARVANTYEDMSKRV